MEVVSERGDAVCDRNWETTDPIPSSGARDGRFWGVGDLGGPVLSLAGSRRGRGAVTMPSLGREKALSPNVLCLYSRLADQMTSYSYELFFFGIIITSNVMALGLAQTRRATSLSTSSSDGDSCAISCLQTTLEWERQGGVLLQNLGRAWASYPILLLSEVFDYPRLPQDSWARSLALSPGVH